MLSPKEIGKLCCKAYWNSFGEKTAKITGRGINQTINTTLNLFFEGHRYYLRRKPFEKGGLYKFEESKYPTVYKKTNRLKIKNEKTGLEKWHQTYEPIDLEDGTICIFLRYLSEDGEEDILTDKVEILAEEQLLIVAARKNRHVIEKRIPESVLKKIL